nr:immunoglobulin heavy chain junction region [Mus musculus]NSM04264.1 immunoglobulin heavy chain junction region [Mus musculus]NSM04624.1 immunoglobulin heavy chain junction region [Mus musculus]NSM05598.1 immunoglobulin heavy chain junction region [Mus musculus]NSM07205.1 immunoglobulin heavy chain junction region [Mus musculus]
CARGLAYYSNDWFAYW